MLFKIWRDRHLYFNNFKITAHEDFPYLIGSSDPMKEKFDPTNRGVFPWLFSARLNARYSPDETLPSPSASIDSSIQNEKKQISTNI